MTAVPADEGAQGRQPVSDIGLISQMLPMDALMRMTGPEPQPVYDELARQCPVRETSPGVFTLLRMQDILDVNRHPAVLGNGSLDRGMGGNHKLIPLDIDGAEHTQYRKMLDKVFAPKRVALLEGATRAAAGELLDAFADVGSVEAFGQFCQPLPSRMFLSIMGIPLADLPYFLGFKDGVLRQEIGEDQAVVEARRTAASERCAEWFGAKYDERGALPDPGEDLLGWLVAVEHGGQKLSRDEFVNVCLLLMIAGLDTVAASLSCMLSWLARHPEQRRWVVEDDARWPAAVEELLRYESPVPQGFRMTMEDIEISGRAYPAGSRFCLSWPGANLDPEVFDDPLSVDLARSPNPHLDFASGRHRCLGSHLARMELRVALEEWHRRIPDYEVEPGVQLEYLPLGVRQVMHLPLRWPPA
jgi:cytochrome P450